MTRLCFERMPRALTARPQWVLWKMGIRDGKLTKIPYQTNGCEAKSNDSLTWTTFDAAVARFQRSGYLGLGYVFSTDDPFVGIDLDSCRDPVTGAPSEWAREIVARFGTYAEISPSRSGVKLFCRGKSPFDRGKKCPVDGPPIDGKRPGIEIYDHGRYFAMTGWKVAGVSPEPIDCQTQIDELCKRYWPERPRPPCGGNLPLRAEGDSLNAIERARRYVAKMPPAISGQHGHDRAYRCACVLVCGFGLTPDEAFPIFCEYNSRCDPPWSEREILHKLEDANNESGERGTLLTRGLAVNNSELKPLPKVAKVPRSNAAKYGLQPVKLCATGGIL